MGAADDCPERTWWGCHCDTEEALGAVGNPSGAAAVEPEGKLFEIAGEVFAAYRSLMSAEDPSLEQREDQMNPWQHRRGGLIEPR